MKFFETNKEIIEDLKLLNKNFIKNRSRLKHVYNVVDYALELCNTHNIEKYDVEISCFAHDLFRDFKKKQLLSLAKYYNIVINNLEKNNPILLHGKVAAHFCRKKYNISNRIFNSIYYHTSGFINFDEVGKIIVIADSLEYGRIFNDINHLRYLSKKSIDLCYQEIIKNKIFYSIKNNWFLLNETINNYNSFILEVNKIG